MSTVFDPRRRMHIPRGIAQLGVGKDDYLRDLTVVCGVCGYAYRLRESDSPDLCQSCYDEAGEENARLDGRT